MSLSPALNIHCLFKKNLFILVSSFVWSEVAPCLELCSRACLKGEKDGWEKKKMVRKREAETRQIEVRDRSQPGKRDKHDLSGHILHRLSGTLKHWKTAGLQEAPESAVPSADQWRRGDQQCMTIILTGTCHFHCLLQRILTNSECLPVMLVI